MANFGMRGWLSKGDSCRSMSHHIKRGKKCHKFVLTTCGLTFLFRFTCTKKSCWQNGETIILLSSNIYHILLYIYTLHIYIYTLYVNKLIFFFNVSLYIIQLLYTDIMAALIVSTIIAYSHNILIILLRNLFFWLSLQFPILR